MKNIMVIVNYRDVLTTIRLLDNVKEYKILDEIIVVDNHSKDNSVLKLNNLNIKKMTVIETKENKGYSYALNIGCKEAIRKYKDCNLIISNSDIIIDREKDLKELINTLSDTNVIVAPNIIEDNKLSRGWHIPSPVDDIKQNIIFFGKNYFDKKLRYSDAYYKNHLSKVDTVSGCFFLVKSKHLENIDYFDENVFLYYEENIFGIKTKRLKKNIVINNDIDVVHDHAKTIDKNLKRINKYKILKQSQYYFEKCYNNANKLELLMLSISAKITQIFLFIKYIFD
ncbi:MAG: glycosyltransferase family 2 protein [Bacilli bacterium]|nr:glycosyltransferase family 2 protein [Bacilli bacterium]